MNKLPSLVVLLSAAFLQAGAQAQPEVDPNAPGSNTYSIAELERFLGGRTLLTLDVKDASIQEVAAAMSQSSGLKVIPFSPIPEWGEGQPMARYATVGGAPVSEVKPFASNATFTLAAQGLPFWEALRNWNLEARRSAQAAGPGSATNNRVSTKPPLKVALNSFGMSQTSNGWQTIPGNWLADGRAASAWPFLIIATNLERAQAARLSRTGLQEPKQPHDALAVLKRRGAPAPAPPAAGPLPEEKHWSDQLILNAYALPDPKLFPTDLSCEVTEAVDDKGNDLRVPNGVTMQYQQSGSVELGKGRPLQIALASKPGMGKKLTRLRGVLRFSLTTRTQHWETTDLKTPVENTLRQGGDEFKIGFKGMTQQGNIWTVNFEAESRGTQLEQFWKNRVQANGGQYAGSGIWGLVGLGSMLLVDANGRTFEMAPSVAGFGLGRRIKPDGSTQPVSPELSPVPDDVAENWHYTESHHLSFRSPTAGLEAGGPVGPPVKLSVDFALDRRYIAVPFEFTDLPLPPS